jgi:hypothetical protein
MDETNQPGAFKKAVSRRKPAPGLGLRLPRIQLRSIGPAFWTIASMMSLVVNILLIALLLGAGRELFALKKMVSDGLVGGLYTNFVRMDEAHIQTTILVSDTIQVKDSIPVVFDLPLSQTTDVILAQDTPLSDTTIFLNGVPVPLNLILKQGTHLNISMDMTVPVSQTVPVVLNVPVSLKVPVDIPLNQTQLHEPFVGLQNVIAPYHSLLDGAPNTAQDLPICDGGFNLLCRWYFKEN